MTFDIDTNESIFKENNKRNPCTIDETSME